MVSEADYEKLNKSVSEATPWRETASKVFKDPSELANAGSVWAKANKAGVNLDRLLESLAKPEDKADPSQTYEEKLNALEARLRGDFAKQSARDRAAAEHESKYTKQINDLKAKMGERLKGLPDKVKDLLVSGAQFKYEMSRKQYGQDHPLAGGYDVLGDEDFGKFDKDFEDLPELLKAQIIREIGEAAGRGVPGVAGNQTDAAKGDKKTDPIAERRERALKTTLNEAAKRRGMPVSAFQ